VAQARGVAFGLKAFDTIENWLAVGFDPKKPATALALTNITAA
jgi:tryptophanyl-tRNA synthetase